MAETVGVLSLKGGVGKTIIAVHLAHYLHEEAHKKVVLVDGEGTHGSLRWHQRGDPFEFPVIGTENYQPQKYRSWWQVFDTPAHPSEAFLSDLKRTLTLAIIPVTPNLDASLAALQLAPYLQDKMPVRTVLANVPTRADGVALHEYLQEQGLWPYKTVLRSRKAYEYARYEGVPVYASSQRARMAAWLEFCELGKEIVHG